MADEELLTARLSLRRPAPADVDAIYPATPTEWLRGVRTLPAANPHQMNTGE
ncbi:MAG: hypothetical protein ACRDTM_09300 [Micromonosporaceae bacterium]